MTVYVYRDGQMVERVRRRQKGEVLLFPTPMISHMEPFESPVSGVEITSWGQRDREMLAHNCFDPRDLSADFVYRRGRDVQMKEVEELRANDTGRTD